MTTSATTSTFVAVALLGVVATPLACRRDPVDRRAQQARSATAPASSPDPEAPGEPVGHATVTSADLPRAGSTATVEVSGDQSALVVLGPPEARRPIVYLHGMCADPREDLEAWGRLATELGTIVSLFGDVPCPDKPGRTRWSDDVEELDARITAALDAAVTSGVTPPLARDDVLLVGESMGAARAESLAAARPERYARLVLVGSPRTPRIQNLRRARAVATVAGDREPQGAMRGGARVLAGAGVASRFFSLPGATHGRYGPDGERVMRAAVGFASSE